MTQDQQRNAIAELVANMVSEIFDAMFPETRVDSFKGGINKTGSLVLPAKKVTYLKRLKNKNYHKWPKKYKEQLENITQEELHV